MSQEEFTRWFYDKLEQATGIEYLKEWFIPEDLETYLRERSFRKYDWDDPIDWINGITIGMAFNFREILTDNNIEAKFRIQLAMFISDLVGRIERNEN